jgi:hypothetical protein
MNKQNLRTSAVLAILAVVMVFLCVDGLSQGSSKKSREWGNTAPLPPSPRLAQAAALQRFPEANKDELLTFVNTHFPHEMLAARKAADVNANNAADMMSDAMAESLDLMELRRHSKELFKMTMEERRLERIVQQQAKVARKDESKSPTVNTLKATLGDAFDVKQELLKKDIEGMSQELAKLRVLVGKRSESREAIIAKRLDEMMGEDEHLRW